MTALVATVLELTDRVQAAIEAGDWAHAQELETERRRLLEQLATAPDVGSHGATFAALEARNHRLIGLVEHQKRRVLRESAVARTAQFGVAAYAALETGSDTLRSGCNNKS
jgi:hypothetical protein